MKLIPVVMSLLFTGIVWADELQSPVVEPGHVTMSWQKFNDLWNSMKGMEKRIDTLTHPDDHPLVSNRRRYPAPTNSTKGLTTNKPG